MSINSSPPKIDIEGINNIDEIIDNAYEIYKSQLMDRENRIKLFGKFIYIDCKSWINRKAEMFWHLSSLSENEQFNILPCTNDSASVVCNENCITNLYKVILSNGEKRNLCIYRSIRINWIREVIDLANKGLGKRRKASSTISTRYSRLYNNISGKD